MQNLTAQESKTIITRDLEFWSGAEFQYKINKRWDLSFEEQLRLKSNASTVDQFYSELNFNYDLSKAFNLGFGTRYIRNNDNTGKIQGYENHVRYNFDASYKQKIERMTLQYRFRFQTKNEIGISASQGDEIQNDLRFKISSEYNIKKWKLDPSISAEYFRGLDSQSDSEKIRFSLGSKYSLKKYGDIKFYYQLEKEIGPIYPKTTNIIGVKYNFELKNKKNAKSN